MSIDPDFHDLTTTAGPPPKVVWVRRWTHPTADAERALRREAIRIPVADDSELAVLVVHAAADPKNDLGGAIDQNAARVLA